MFETLKSWRLQRRLKLHAAYQRIFDTPEGKQVLQHICEVGHVFKPTFVNGDPHQTSFNEGKRVLALSILKFIKKDHDAMLDMVEKSVNIPNKQ